jgi:hypothetical protein
VTQGARPIELGVRWPLHQALPHDLYELCRAEAAAQLNAAPFPPLPSLDAAGMPTTPSRFFLNAWTHAFGMKATAHVTVKGSMSVRGEAVCWAAAA